VVIYENVFKTQSLFLISLNSACQSCPMAKV